MQHHYRNPLLRLAPGYAFSGDIHWQSPSNIAIVKYWGKHGQQLPRNASISFTLRAAYTEMELSYRPRETQDSTILLDFYFEGEAQAAFAQKISKLLTQLAEQELFPFLPQFELTVHSSNSFPHSAGIASSASSMSALALCLCTMEQELFGTLTQPAEFFRKASFLARLGSGSACRSLYPVMGEWGALEKLEGSSDLWASPCAEWIHPLFHTYHDDILIVSKGEKSVSSRAGHQLMEGNPYASARYQQANDNMGSLIDILKAGDASAFGQIAEQEALTLHALMMSSQPPYVLMKPNSLAMIEKIRQFRTETNQPLYFTLDAGPNLHLLYPHEIETQVAPFIQSELLPLCEEGKIIRDQVGQGAVKL
jgi:diphosphomevalonate decarboxylase